MKITNKEVEVLLNEAGVCVCGAKWARPFGQAIHEAISLVRNATEKIVRGTEQLLRYDDAVRILAINVQSPDVIFIVQQIVETSQREVSTPSCSITTISSK